MYGIGKLLDKKYGGLIFSLLSGLAYFIIILDYIINSTAAYGMLLGLFFFPAIIAGSALIILKTINRLKTEEKFRQINAIIYLHILLMLVSIPFLIDIIK